MSIAHHRCHAHGCASIVPPRMFMCRRHWMALPLNLRSAVWRHYVPGQEQRKDPSASYMAVAWLAVASSAFRPGDEGAARVSQMFIREACQWQARAVLDGSPDPLAGLLPGG